MAGIGLDRGISASAHPWKWGDVAEVRSQAMTWRAQMRHYLTRSARGHGKPREMAVARGGMTGRRPVGRGSGWRFPSLEGIRIHFMAQRIQTLLIDDLDGGEADGTVRFGLDGTD